jgi:hypothetical protein
MLSFANNEIPQGSSIESFVKHAILFVDCEGLHIFWLPSRCSVSFRRMFTLATLMTLISQVSGTPYVTGGDSLAGTDFSGLASWVSNVATGRPAFGDRFTTHTEESALLARGFQYGTQPEALVIGWNSYHTAVTLPDGTSISSGERGGVKIGGAGAYQPQFTHHMFLPMPAEEVIPPEGVAPTQAAEIAADADPGAPVDAAAAAAEPPADDQI